MSKILDAHFSASAFPGRRLQAEIRKTVIKIG